MRAGLPVTVVARKATADALNRHGLEVRSALLGDFHVPVRAVPRLENQAAVVFVCTKAPDLEPALERVADHAADSLVVPFLNGVDHMQTLRERWAERATAASIRIESQRTDTGSIVQSGRLLLVELASHQVERDLLQTVAGLLEQAGIPSRVLDSEAAVLWGKLVRVNAVACTTSATGRPIGWVRSNPEWRARLEGCVREAAAVASAEGAPIAVRNSARGVLDRPPCVADELDEPRASRCCMVRGELDAIPGPSCVQPSRTAGPAVNAKELSGSRAADRVRCCSGAPGERQTACTAAAAAARRPGPGNTAARQSITRKASPSPLRFPSGLRTLAASRQRNGPGPEVAEQPVHVVLLQQGHRIGKLL